MRVPGIEIKHLKKADGRRVVEMDNNTGSLAWAFIPCLVLGENRVFLQVMEKNAASSKDEVADFTIYPYPVEMLELDDAVSESKTGKDKALGWLFRVVSGARIVARKLVEEVER